MGQTVDTRVVELKFDNSEFEKNVQTSLKSIDNINKSLDSMGSKKSLGGLDNAAKSLSFDDASKSASILQKRFSVLGVAGMSAINNITNSVMNMGKNMLASLSGINAMRAGFHEYETQLNSVQTILANTKSKGSDINDVNSALNELNHYADKTIYSFTEMTRNIGTFTAAGVGLDKSVASIKGIANLAAVSGSNAQQASTAMYQLSQAIASGSVKLQDWNSVVNAGMGGEVFQNALKRTARAHGIAVDSMIKKYGSFRESLSKGNWLTTKVLTDTLKQFSGDVSEKELIAQGYSKKQIKEIMDMAKTAEDAATKVKTFTQLMDTLAEAVQSGWTESWQYILGDFDEAKKMWTSVSDTLGAFIQKSANARNSMLKFWHDAGGRKALMQSFKNIFDAILAVLKPIHDAFRDVFPPSTGEGLVSFSKGLEKLTSKLIISKETSEKLGEAFKQGFTIISNALKFVKSLLKGLSPLISLLEKAASFLAGKFAQGVLIAVASIEKFINKAVDWVKSNKTIMDALDKIEAFIRDKVESIKKTLKNFGSESGFIKAFKNLFDSFKKTELPKILTSIETVLVRFIKYLEELGSTIKNEGIPAAIDKITSSFEKLFNLLKNEYVPKAIDKLLETFERIKDKVQGIDFKKSAQNLSDGLVLEAYAADNSGKEVAKSTVTMSDRIKAFEKVVAHVFDRVKFYFKQFRDVAVDVFTEVGKFVASGKDFNLDRVIDLAQSTAVVAILWQLQKAINSISVTIGAAGGVLTACSGMLKNVGAVLKAFSLQVKAKALIDMAGAIAILAGALFLLSLIPQNKLIMAGAALGVVGLALVGFAKLMNRIDMKAFGLAVAALSVSLAALAIGVFGLAISMGILIASLYLLVKVFEKYAAMKPEVFQKGFERIRDTITQLVKFLFGVGLSRGKGKGAAISLAALVVSLYVLQNTLKLYAKMDPKIFEKGLARISGVIKSIKGLLLGLVVTTLLSSGPKLIGLSALLLSLVKSLEKLSGVLQKYADMKTSSIKKGLATMSAVLFSIGVFVNTFAFISEATNFRRLLGLSLVLGAMVGIIRGIADAMTILSRIKTGPMVRALVSLELVLTTIAAFTLAVSALGKAKTIESLAALAGLIIALAGAIYFLGKIPAKQAAKGIMILGAALAVLATALNMSGYGQMNMSIRSFLAVTGAAVVLTMALSELAKQPWKSILAACGGLSAVMAALSASTRLIDIGTTLKGLVKFAVISGVAVGIAFVLAKMANLPWEGMIAAGGSLSAVILSMGAAIALVDNFSGLDSGKNIIKFGAMAGMLVVIALSLAGLASIPMEQLIGATADMVLVLGALTAAMYVLGNVDWKTSLKALANAAIFLGGFELMMLAIGKINEMCKPIIGQSKEMVVLLVAMSGAMVLLGKLPIEDSLVALGNLAVLIGGFSLILLALGALSSKFKSISGFITEGGNILGLLGRAIGEFIGGIAAGFSSEIAAVLPSLGNSLGAFGKGCEPFLKTLKSVDASSLKGAAILADTILIITAASFMNGIMSLASFVTGGASFAVFASEIKILGGAMKSYGSQVKGIDTKAVKASAEAVRILAGIKIENEGGLISKLVGDNDLGTFSKNLIPLGKAISGFSNNVSGVSAASITAAAKAIATLAGIKIKGDGSELSKFADKLEPTGRAFTDFSYAVTDMDVDGVVASAKAMSAIASIKVPKKDNFNTFALSLQTLGISLKSFSESIVNVDTVMIEETAKAISSLASIKVANAKSFVTFSNSIGSLGRGIVDFSVTTQDVDTDAIKEVGKAIASIAGIKVANAKGMDQFAGNLRSLGIGFRDFADTVSGISGLKSIASVAKSISTLAGIKFATGKGIVLFAANVESLGNGIKSFAGTVKGLDTKSVSSAAKSISTLADIKFASSTNMNAFAGNIECLGDGIKNFSTNVKGTKNERVQEVAKSISALAGIKFADSTNMPAFAQNLSTLGTGVKDFSTNVKGTENDRVQEAAKSVAALAKIRIASMSNAEAFASNIGAVGTGIKKFSNNVAGTKNERVQAAAKSLSILGKIKVAAQTNTKTFADNLASLGTGLSDFSSKVKGVDTSKVSSAAKSISILSKIKIGNIDGIASFSSKLKSLGSSVKSFINNMNGISGKSVSHAVSEVKKLGSIGNSVKSGTISKFASALRSIGRTGVKAFVTALTGSNARVKKAANSMENSAVKALKSAKSNFYKAGKNAAQGFVNGISSKIQNGDVYAAGLKIGDEAYKAARHALDEHSPSKKMEQVGDYAVKGFLNGLEKGNSSKRITKAVSGIMNRALTAFGKYGLITDFGKGAIDAFVRDYGNASKKVSANKKAATKAINNYAIALYKESDAYKQDKATMKEDLTSLRNLEKERDKLKAKYKKASGESKKTLKSDLKENLKNIKSAKKKVESDAKAIAANIKKTYADMKQSIKDAVKSFADPISLSLESGISLLEKFSSNNADTTRADNVASAQETLTEATNDRIAAEKELTDAQAKSDAVNGRSQKYLDAVAEAEDKVTEAKQKELEATNALNAAKKDTDASDMLANMKSQLDGYKQWQDNLSKLASNKSLSKGLLAQLKELGISGYDQVEAFVKMTDEELAKASDMYNQTQQIASQTLIDNFKQKIQQTKEWAANMTKLAASGLNKDMLAELAAKGPEGADYVDAFLNMTAQELADFNKTYAAYTKTQNSVANTILASLAEAEKLAETKGKSIGTKAINGMKKAVASGSASLSSTASQTGKAATAAFAKHLSVAKGASIGSDMDAGLSKGIKQGRSGVINEAVTTAVSSYKAARDALKIKSPSKKFEELGMYSDLGLAKGLTKYAGVVQGSSEDLASSAITSLSNSLSVMPSIMDGIDDQPTIRPVLDLTDIENGVSTMNGMFGSETVNANGSAQLASKIAGTSAEIQNGANSYNSTNNNQQIINNEFHITGDNPKEIADEVSKIIQKQADRRGSLWV